MSTPGIRSMVGFDWSPTPRYLPMKPGEDGWCMRDAICELSGWEPGSEEWYLFVEGPQGPDTPRLAEHLDLACFQVPQDWKALIGRLTHPGAAIFDFPAYQKSHVVYVHDLQWLMHHWPDNHGRWHLGTWQANPVSNSAHAALRHRAGHSRQVAHVARGARVCGGGAGRRHGPDTARPLARWPLTSWLPAGPLMVHAPCNSPGALCCLDS